jgi:hypothetical protein
MVLFKRCRWSPATGLIEKETDGHRTPNAQHQTLNDCILSVFKDIAKRFIKIASDLDSSSGLAEDQLDMAKLFIRP